MTEHTDANNDELPEHLIDAARTYNEPPMNVPREEMWAAIAKARAGKHDDVGARRAWRTPRRTLWTWALAASALLAVGYGIGRMARPEDQPELFVAEQTSRAPSRADALVATDLFARAEVFLTGFDRNPAVASTDTALAQWSRTLLRDTRLLLDSPAAADAARRALLESLERILMQIARGLGARDTADLTYTSEALRASTLMNQLRTSVPAGTAPRSED